MLIKHFLLATVLAGLPLLASTQAFSVPVRSYAGSTTFGLAVGDLNGDVHADVVVSIYNIGY